MTISPAPLLPAGGPPPLAPDARRRVVIVGGGLAGLAAAAALVHAGETAITLIESRPRLGGRASSFPDPLTGELVDNCQHVSMACCTNLADFCRKVGTADLFRRVPDVRFLSPEGKLSTLAAWPLARPPCTCREASSGPTISPGPSGSAWLTASPGSRPGVPIGRHGPDESVLAFLRRNGQTERTIRRYWGTVLISALNEQLRPDGRRPCSEGLRRRLPPAPRRLPDGDPPGPPRRTLRQPARNLARGARGRRPPDDRGPRGRGRAMATRGGSRASASGSASPSRPTR